MKAIRGPIENVRISEDRMSEDDLARLDEALVRGFESIKAGRFRPAADVIADLRRG
jgi:hypothetical protein